MPPTINLEWLNSNSLRAYPFHENAQRIPVASNGSSIPEAQIPNYMLVDLVVTIADATPSRMYLSRLGLVGNLLSLVFADAADGIIATLAVDLDTHATYDAYDIVGTGAANSGVALGTYDDVRGRVVLGDLTDLRTDLAEGFYSFPITMTEMEAATVRPALRGVRSLRVVNQGIAESEYIYGHVKFLAGSNVRLTYLPEYNTIRIDAIEAAGFSEECECDPAVGEQNIVRTINGIPVQDAEIIGDGQCVNVTTSGSQIVITDVCSAPCCGCPELEFITDSLKILESTLDNLQSYSNQLAERISTFVTNYILTVQ